LQSLVARRDSLADLRSARQRSLASVQVQRRQWEEQADALEAESARVASVIAAAPPAPQSGSDGHVPTRSSAAPSSAGFVWPLRGAVVSPYGQRWGRLHASDNGFTLLVAGAMEAGLGDAGRRCRAAGSSIGWLAASSVFLLRASLPLAGLVRAANPVDQVHETGGDRHSQQDHEMRYRPLAVG
jgi:hypothetical protein